MGFPRGTAARRTGYTLVELMMIVTIIGVSVLAFAPSFGRQMSERRVSTASRELIRIGRRARSDTFGYLRAHLIYLSPTSGRVMLLRAPTSSCTLTEWAPIAEDCDKGLPRCLEDLKLANWASSAAPIRMYEEQYVAGEVAYDTRGRALCFAASGVTYWGSGNTVTAATTALSETISEAVPGGFVYTLHASVTAGAPLATSRVHRVLFPLGGSPRSLR